MTQSIEYTIQRIREFRKVNGLAKFRLAVLAGIPEGCTRNIDSKDWNPQLSTLKKLEAIIPNTFSLNSTKKVKK